MYPGCVEINKKKIGRYLLKALRFDYSYSTARTGVTRKTCRKDYRITRENKDCKGDTDSKQIKKR